MVKKVIKKMRATLFTGFSWHGYDGCVEFKPPPEPTASHKALIIGVSVGSVVLAAAIILALLVIFGVVPIRKRQPKQTESLG